MTEVVFSCLVAVPHSRFLVHDVGDFLINGGVLCVRPIGLKVLTGPLSTFCFSFGPFPVPFLPNFLVYFRWLFPLSFLFPVLHDHMVMRKTKGTA